VCRRQSEPPHDAAAHRVLDTSPVAAQRFGDPRQRLRGDGLPGFGVDVGVGGRHIDKQDGDGSAVAGEPGRNLGSAGGGGSGRIEGGVLVQDAFVQRPQLWSGFHAELVDQRLASLPIRLQSLGLPTGPIERKYQLLA
jgi:hypothetical protein